MATKTVTPTREAINATMAYGRETQRPGLATLKPEQETAAGALLNRCKECNDRGSQGSLFCKWSKDVVPRPVDPRNHKRS